MSKWISVPRVVIVLLAGGLVLPATLRAGQPLSLATGYEALLGVLDPGSLKCVGGEPTGLPFPFCTPETRRIRLRGKVAQFEYTQVVGTAKEMFQGINTATVNCVFDGQYRGTCWGRFNWDVPGSGGSWEGTWSGSFNLAINAGIYSAHGSGRGGDLEGLQVRAETIYPGGVPWGMFLAQVIGAD